MNVRALSAGVLLAFSVVLAGCAGYDSTAPAPVLELFAGDAAHAGAVDGARTAARFTNPFGIATDRAGNVYVSDRGNNTIRKVTPAGMVSTLAGTAGVTGSADGAGAAASFDYPSGIATDHAGNVYVADYGNRTIRKITPAGVVTTFAGAAGARGGHTDGVGAAARFHGPLCIATDSTGNLYVGDMRGTIRKITPAGVVTTFAGKAFNEGGVDGIGVAASFDFPRGIATDSAGNVYVTDGAGHTLRKITPAGVVTTLAGKYDVESAGSADGPGADARFSSPLGIAVDGAGNIYVADNAGLETGHTIRKITPAGIVSTVVGVAGQRGFEPGPLPGRLEQPRGLAINGNVLYIIFTNALGDSKDAAGGVAVVRNKP